MPIQVLHTLQDDFEASPPRIPSENELIYLTNICLIKLNGCCAEPKRGPLEPVMPKYGGFIPRIGPTGCSLGARYHLANDNGLKMFDYENCSHFDILKLPIQVQTYELQSLLNLC